MKNKIINLNKDLETLDGKILPGENNMGKILAQNLVFSVDKENYLKFYDWGTRLYKGETLELDRSDYEKLRKFIEGLDLPNITKAQIMPLIENDKIE